MRWDTSPPSEPLPYKRWFAWHPINLGCGKWVWFEWVERKLYYPYTFSKIGAFYIYKELK